MQTAEDMIISLNKVGANSSSKTGRVQRVAIVKVNPARENRRWWAKASFSLFYCPLNLIPISL
jgi:hypothetical protein